MAEPTSPQDYRAHILYAPLDVDDNCPFEDGSQDDRGIATLLETRAFRVTCANNFLNDEEFGSEAVQPVSRDRPGASIDVIVADCRTLTPQMGRLAAAFGALRKQHPESIFLVLIEPELSWDFRLQLKRYGTLCPIGERADLIVPRLHRLLDNLALADECGERLKTLASLSRSTVQGSILQTPKTPMQVLVSGMPSPLTLRAMKSLSTNEFKITAAISVPQTVRYLEMGSFDCLIVLPGDRTAIYTGMIKMLRRNDRTRSLPILIIPARADGAQATSSRFMAQGADTVLYEPDTEKGLMAEVTAYTRRNRLTASMKQFLRKAASQDGSGSNVVTDLQFFETHLERQCQASQSRARPICLSAFRLKYMSGKQVTSAAFEQALKYAQMIIRDTDLITAVRGDIFLVAQPGLIKEDAERKQHNIAEVLQEIILDASGSTASEFLTIETCTVQHLPGEDAAQMLSRAFKGFAAMPMKQPAPSLEKPTLRIVR